MAGAFFLLKSTLWSTQDNRAFEPRKVTQIESQQINCGRPQAPTTPDVKGSTLLLPVFSPLHDAPPSGGSVFTRPPDGQSLTVVGSRRLAFSISVNTSRHIRTNLTSFHPRRSFLLDSMNACGQP